jgi:hypothetical protein
MFVDGSEYPGWPVLLDGLDTVAVRYLAGPCTNPVLALYCSCTGFVSDPCVYVDSWKSLQSPQTENGPALVTYCGHIVARSTAAPVYRWLTIFTLKTDDECQAL